MVSLVLFDLALQVAQPAVLDQQVKHLLFISEFWNVSHHHRQSADASCSRWRRVRPRAPRDLLESPPAVRRTRFVWGNMITALPASQTAVRGPHPQRLRIDEADEMLLAVLDAAHGQPMDRAGVQAQTVISSTHQHPDGTMTAVLQRAAAQFKRTYNEQWMLEKYDYRSPAQVRRDLLGLDAAA